MAVARALVLEPAVLLFDEPLSNLDARLRRQMREEIRDLQQRLGLTVVYVTHDQAEAMAVSDRIIVMNQRDDRAGRRAARALRAADATRSSRGSWATPIASAASSRVAMGRSATCRLGAVTLSLPHRGLADGDVELSIRPESIALRPAGETPLARPPCARPSYLGGVIEYSLDTGIGELFVVSTAVEHPLAVGRDSVGVELARHGVVLIPPGQSA